MSDLQTIFSDGRKPAVFLNYKNDVRKSFDVNRPYGPNDLHEMLFPVTMEYDEEKNMTRIGFAYQPPNGFYNTDTRSKPRITLTPTPDS